MGYNGTPERENDKFVEIFVTDKWREDKWIRRKYVPISKKRMDGKRKKYQKERWTIQGARN